MQLATSLSDQQNAAIWFFGTLVGVLIVAVFVAGLLGSVQRTSEPKA